MTLMKSLLQCRNARLGAVVVALTIGYAATGSRAQAPNPSFSCAKARTADEKAICQDARLAELDRAVSQGYASVPANMRDSVKGEAKDLLAARGKCGADRLCILEQQVGAVSMFAN